MPELSEPTSDRVPTPHTVTTWLRFDDEEIAISADLTAWRQAVRRYGGRSHMSAEIDAMPGAVVEHAVLTPECRENRGDQGAINEAITRVWNQYYAIVDGWKDAEAQPTLHLILTLVRPRDSSPISLLPSAEGSLMSNAERDALAQVDALREALRAVVVMAMREQSSVAIEMFARSYTAVAQETPEPEEAK